MHYENHILYCLPDDGNSRMADIYQTQRTIGLPYRPDHQRIVVE